MKQDTAALHISVSEDPLESFLNTVIGIATSDNRTIRGRLIKFDERVIWLHKMDDRKLMVARDDIRRLWQSRDCKQAAIL